MAGWKGSRTCLLWLGSVVTGEEEVQAALDAVDKLMLEVVMVAVDVLEQPWHLEGKLEALVALNVDVVALVLTECAELLQFWDVTNTGCCLEDPGLETG